MLSLLQKYQWTVLVTTWLSYGILYFLRKPLGVIKPMLELDLKLTKSQLGWLDVALLGPYSIAQVSTSRIADKIGPRLTISLSLTLAGTAMFTFGYWNSYLVLFVLMGINGAMQGPCWPAACKIVSTWYPDSQINTVIGLMSTSAFVGGALGTTLAVTLQSAYGWRIVHVPPALLALFVGLISYLVLYSPSERQIAIPGKNNSSESRGEEEKGKFYDEERSDDDRTKKSFWELWKLAGVAEITFTVLCLKVVRYSMFMWLPMYLIGHLNYSITSAGLFSTIFDIGGAIGSPLLGLFLDRYFPSSPLFGVVIVVGISFASLLLFALTSHLGVVENGLFILIAGGTNCGVDSLLAGSFSMKMGEADGMRSGAAVTGLVNGIGTLGAVFEGPIVGFIAETFGWSAVFIFMILLSAIATLTVFKAMLIQKRIDRISSITPYREDKMSLLA